MSRLSMSGRQLLEVDKKLPASMTATNFEESSASLVAMARVAVPPPTTT